MTKPGTRKARLARRTLRVGGSFAVVVAAYWVYAVAIVPLVDPPADPRPAQVSRDRQSGGRNLTDRRIDAIRGLFSSDAWELQDTTKILESDQVKLLMRDFTNLNNGCVKLCPCTIIFTPGGPYPDDDPRNRQAVVLRAPEGATLQFDKPFNLRQVEIGRLVGGQLMGPITISSQGRQPGEDLLILTRDIQLKDRDLATPNPVDFRWGRTFGRGTDLHIKLLPVENGQGSRHGPDIGGMELFEVRHVERLHLETAKSSPPLPTSAAPAANGSNPVAPAAIGQPGAGLIPGGAPDLPVEITCTGPLQFDPIKLVASFKQQVHVERIHPGGPPDELHGDLLSIFFISVSKKPSTGNPPGDVAPAKSPTTSTDLAPQRIEVQGNPVVLSSPSQRVFARGQQMTYDLQANRIKLDGGPEVMLQQGPNEIHARSLRYTAGTPGHLGTVLAEGPGWLRGQMDDKRPEEQLEAWWKDQLSLEPDGQRQLISLNGNVTLKFRAINQLDADEVRFWLLELPAAGNSGQTQLRPDRMVARNRVHLESPQLSGATEQLDVEFKPLALRRGATTAGPAPQYAANNGRIATAVGSTNGPSLPQDLVSLPTADGPVPSGQPVAPGQPSPAQQHFSIAGRSLQVKVLIDENNAVQPSGQAMLSELTVEDNATFDGGGYSLVGPNIHLNCETNRLWVDGAGQMQLPIDRDLDNRPLQNRGTLHVQWQKGLDFDGHRARFEGHQAQVEDWVVAATPAQNLRTPTLEVFFQQPVQFANPQSQQEPKAERIVCGGGVLLANRGVDPQGLLSSQGQMQVGDLTINLITGALEAHGPGSLTNVLRGGDDPLAIGGRTEIRNKPPVPAMAQLPEQLKCLNVTFDGPLTGNVHRHQLTFHDQVQAIYAPIGGWDAKLPGDTPEVLGPGSVVLRSDEMSVTEMDAPLGNRKAIEFNAAGNVVAESATYFARGQRLSYDESKDQLILEGGGRANAELFQQQQVGGRPNSWAARKIFYWPKTKRVHVEDVRYLDFNGAPSGKPAKK